MKREEEKHRRITPPSTEAGFRVEVTDSSVVYVTPDSSSATADRKLTPTLVAISEISGRTTTTVRVGGDISDATNHATTIEVIGMSEESTSKEATSTSDKESTDEDDDDVRAPIGRELSVKLSEQNAERLRRIRESRRKTSPPVTLARRATLSDEDSDYDADCSATESPRKAQAKRHVSPSQSSQSSSASSGRSKTSPTNVTASASRGGVTILEEEEEEDAESIKNRVIRRVDTRC
jgi:hypothetical protein